jgi:hypothetical protein
MTEDHIFIAEIKPVGEFRIGDTDPAGNAFQLSIGYRGKETVILEDCTFYLRVEVGCGPEALVQNHEAANNIEPVISSDHEIEIDGFSSKKQFVWKICSYDDSPIESDKPIVIDYSNIISQTEPGKVKFTFAAIFHDQKIEVPLIGELVKKSDRAGIIYFYSTTEQRQSDLTTPECIVPSAEQIFPGEKVILKWYIPGLRKETLKLTQYGRTLLSKDDFKNDKGEAVFEDIRQNTEFVLSGKVDKESKPKSSKIRVDVLSNGWNDSTKRVDGIDLEPTLLFNANNQAIYAVFRCKFPGEKEKGLLFQTGNPFWGWTSIKAAVPEGFVTSPGVFCDNKLWFIGGSRIDPDKASNRACSFDPDKIRWDELDPAPWAPRMGHACLRIPPDEKKQKKEQIWIMGGCDRNGNALKDVWALDVSTKKWQKFPVDLPREGSMFSPVIFKNDIWLGGGLIDPLSDELFTDIFVFSGEKWEKKEKGLAFIEGKPMTACLQVFQNKLHVVGKTRIRSAIETFIYYLKIPTTDSWESLSSDALQGWGEDLTLSYQLINFNDKLLIAKALGYENPNLILKAYAP